MSIISGIKLPLENEERCFNNMPHQILEDIVNGIRVCQNCGLIIDTQIIEPELSLPRMENSHENGKNRREFTNYAGIKYFSTLQPKFQESLPQHLNRAIKQNVHLTWQEKKELIGLQEMKKNVEKFGLSFTIRDQAINLFRRAIKDHHFRGKQIQFLMYAALFYSIKSNQNPIELGVLLGDDEISEKTVLKYYYDLIHHFKLTLPRVTCINYIHIYANALKVDVEVIKTAQSLYQSVSSQPHFSTFDPKGMAIVCLYYACKIAHIIRSHAEIARIANISPETLRLRVRANEKFIIPIVKSIPSL